MKLKLSIAPKLTLVFVLFAGAVLVALGIPAYNDGQAALEAATFSYLLTTAIEKQAALDNWVTDRQYSISHIASQIHLQEATAALLAAVPGSAEASLAHADLVRDLANWSGEGHRFVSMEVIDAATGKVIAATADSEEGKFRENQPYFINGLETAYVQNPYYDLSQQQPAMTGAAPILSPDGQVIAVLAAPLNLEEMNAIIQHRSGLRRTEDAFLVNASSLFVTQPRLISDPAVLQRGIHTEAVNRCLTRNSGVTSALDYRGIPAFIVYRWMPERQLCLITKIDQEEALAPSRALAASMALTGGLVLLIGSLLAVGLSRSFTRPIRQLALGAEQLGKGNLDYRLEIKPGDEIGLLGAEFNHMAAAIAEKDAQLRIWTVELEQKVAQRTAELSASEERYRILAETSPDMIYVIDKDGKVQYVNTQVARQFGKTPEDVVGKPPIQLFPPSVFQSQETGLLQVLKSGEPFSLEIPAVIPGGQLWLDTQLVPLRNEVGEVSAVMGVSRDITERKLAVEKLNKTMEDLTRSNAELERFAYVASHDLQEPLRMVTSYLQLLEHRYKDKLDSNAQEFINYAVDGATRMKNLINDLLSYSRVGTRGKEFASTNCEEVLAHVLDTLQVTIKENRAIVTHDPLPKIWADDTQIESLFQNLIGNAIKFRSKKPPKIHIGVEQKVREWVFSVSDNGIGIDPQYFERIFIIFQRLHNRDDYPGTGIGLAISKRIIEHHGGRIWIESQPGKGSTFFFSFPSRGELL